jgi:hypothetical protein
LGGQQPKKGGMETLERQCWFCRVVKREGDQKLGSAFHVFQALDLRVQIRKLHSGYACILNSTIIYAEQRKGRKAWLVTCHVLHKISSAIHWTCNWHVICGHEVRYPK